ncbi:EAL domain-containing protein [Desulfovibrio sp. ZJ200]|uniref:EAL domain-containing protein n=1 Tax=Desulfovibrio sp. ZJ200 TaxID=2709792 RepID=UPI0013EA4046|nr:EAL domain-containing protein [Desulfovibrio sp. ZJ200]
MIFRTLCLLPLLLSLSLALLPGLCPAVPAQQMEVRVGYFENGDYMRRNRDGEFIGFNIEFLHEISKFSGLNLHMVDAGSWQHAQAMLEKGEIDLLAAVHRTPEREQKMSFSDQPMLNIFTTLNVRENDERYDYEDFDSFWGMKVGIIANSRAGEKFKKYCQDNNIDLTIIPYTGTAPLFKALEDKTLDGVATTYPGRNSFFRGVAQFSPEPVYIAVAQNRPDLLARVNKAMNIMTLRDPYYAMRLYDKYFSFSARQKPVFTDNEQKFIRRKNVIKAAYDPTWRPLGYKDSKSGRFSGVVADLFQQITEYTGLVFEFIPLPQQEALELASRGKIDVICALAGDYLWNEYYKLNGTVEYLRTPAMVVRTRQKDEIDTIALRPGWLSKKVAEENADKRILYYDSTAACMEAVLQGKADATYGNAHVVNYLRTNPRYANLDTTPLGKYTSPLRIGVSRHADPRLFTILDKSVQYISTEVMDDLVLKNTIRPRSLSLREFVAEHPVKIFSGLVAVFGSIILLLLYNLYIKSRSNRRIQALLYRDSLTGLDNMDKFCMESETLLAKAHNKGYALLYGDISQFKIINDSFGFTMGDQLLRAYGHIMSEAVGEGELCARVSADHFILLLRYTDWDNLAARIESIDKELDNWRRSQGMPYRINTVFGVYLVNPLEKHSSHLMLDLANYARRNAKLQRGKNALVLYDEDMRQNALLQRELNGQLDMALERGELEAWFQPKVDMPSGKIIGSEALVRWRHPTRGLLMPGSFMPFFESNGSVTKIDLHIFEQACKALRAWQERSLPRLPISCNFSSLHFTKPDFPDRLEAIADRYNVPHACLEVEITESSLIHNPDAVCKQLVQLKNRGFMIAIDDFGSGYSSLGQLQRLMADVLKLDRSFVQSDTLGERERIVLGNVIQLATQLGMAVICEGVENKAQAATLMQLGCTSAQGFHYARPMPRDDFETLLQKGVIAGENVAQNQKQA